MRNWHKGSAIKLRIQCSIKILYNLNNSELKVFHIIKQFCFLKMWQNFLISFFLELTKKMTIVNTLFLGSQAA